MDKRIILSVAGSGKTTHILDELNLETRSLIITYTNTNYLNLRKGILKRWNYIPANIYLVSFFTFLYCFCYRPFLYNKYKTKGINWEPNLNRFAKNDAKYIDKYQRLYSNRIAKFLEEKNVLADINARLYKYFDTLFIDEVQDIAGHDFNLLCNITKVNMNMLFVGDFFQHTYDTSRDGNVNRNLHNNYSEYKNIFSKLGFNIDLQTLSKSYRCSPNICEFIEDKIGIEIKSHRNDKTEIHFIESPILAAGLYQDKEIIKLFYREHYKYDCYSKNWGECKGEDKYENVCVVLNKTSWTAFQKNKLNELAPLTKNKLYVACSRTKKNLFFVSEDLFEKHKSLK